jgi:hypothetical protein
VESSVKIIGYQLSLLGEEPKPCYAWRRSFYQMHFMGCPMPLFEDEIRQNNLLRADTKDFIRPKPFKAKVFT